MRTVTGPYGNPRGIPFIYGKGSALVKIRYNHDGMSVIIKMTSAGRSRCIFGEPKRDIVSVKVAVCFCLAGQDLK